MVVVLVFLRFSGEGNGREVGSQDEAEIVGKRMNGARTKAVGCCREEVTLAASRVV